MLITRARIYAFPQRPDAGNLLTLRDKLDLHEAGERITRAGLRCVIGRDREGLCHDFVQLHRSSESSVCWTLVRAGPVIRVWRGTHGADLGVFPTLRDAMAAVLDEPATHAPCPRPPGPAKRQRSGPERTSSPRKGSRTASGH